MTLPFQVFFSAHPRVLPVPVVARKYDGDFLSSGKFLWISLEVIVFYGVDISRVGLRLENHGGSCRTPNSELPPLKLSLISSTTPCPQALSFGTSPFEPGWY